MSVDDLTDEYLPYYLLEVTQKHQLAPHTLTLEVTESAIMHNVQKSLAVVNCIHELGFRLAIDDFGTGHSALSQLQALARRRAQDRQVVRHAQRRRQGRRDPARDDRPRASARPQGRRRRRRGRCRDRAARRARLRARAGLRHRQADAARALPAVARATPQRAGARASSHCRCQRRRPQRSSPPKRAADSRSSRGYGQRA